MTPFAALFGQLEAENLTAWSHDLRPLIEQRFSDRYHGNWSRWQSILQSLPEVTEVESDFLSAAVTTQFRPETDDIQALLQGLHPWRKGPFLLNQLKIDSEWRSNLKWNRIDKAGVCFENRVVLDVGCGNGYFGWRMLGVGAKLVIGIDPTLLFVMQFLAVRHFLGEHRNWVLPLGIEDMPQQGTQFDCVVSMGVLYHRRSPIDHLTQLLGLLQPGGELLLETLVVDGDVNTVLVPQRRYAQMRNVWFLPSVDLLQRWISRAGFSECRLVDVSTTSTEEQRSTDWMKFDSLKDFLDSDTSGKTIEGYPGPKRAMLLAKK